MRAVMTSMVLAFGLAAGVAGPSAAQLAVHRSPTHAPELGTTIRGSAPTVFSISTSGGVIRQSGDAIRLSNSSVRTPTVTISCGPNRLESLCALRYIRVRIIPASSQGQAAITRLRVGSLSGGRYSLGGAPSEGAVVEFIMAPLGLFGGDASFELGMDVRLAAGAPGGRHVFDYIVTAELL